MKTVLGAAASVVLAAGLALGLGWTFAPPGAEAPPVLTAST